MAELYGLQMGVTNDTNHLLTGMILQVRSIYGLAVMPQILSKYHTTAKTSKGSLGSVFFVKYDDIHREV